MSRKLNEHGLEAAIITFLQQRGCDPVDVGRVVTTIICDYLEAADIAATLDVNAAAQAQMDNLRRHFPSNPPTGLDDAKKALAEGKAAGKSKADRTWREWASPYPEAFRGNPTPYSYDRVEITRREWGNTTHVIDPCKDMNPYVNVAGLLWRPYEEFPDE